ncbi:sugar transferase [Verrucosispora sp. WMMC514]|uniref:sugar transferase n=1 Tax=Verrucosispora sp. WMMC514 TaxID=3015156 RepID=UPI00248BB53C|nr:sugar transferase [Verrucosispora sp. WMMC514]WBB92322.1 sugar transferase [Verrucosispora sp. WMMC514]
MVIEPADSPVRSDRLNEDFDVVLRVPTPSRTEQLTAILRRLRPKVLLLKNSLDSIDEPTVAACQQLDVEILVLARPVYGLLPTRGLRRFGGLPWIRLRSSQRRRASLHVKRCLDLGIIALSALPALPLILAITIVLSFTGPPFYRQQRVGTGGRPFYMIKFRTMQPGSERDTGPVLAQPEDIRVTRVGRHLRRTRLDELPQLWNVIRGEMSLVGPRPERPEFIAEFRQLPHYDLRHLTRPGLTGLAQLTGGYAATVEEKLRCDLFYLNCRSLRLDLSLLALTVLDLFRGFPRG